MSALILVFGGEAEERSVSIRSAKNLIKNYAFSAFYEVGKSGEITSVTQDEIMTFDVDSGHEFIPRNRPFAPSIELAAGHLRDSVFFLALHGTHGVDLLARKKLEDSNIAFTGSNYRSALRSSDKIFTKLLMVTKDVQIAPHLRFKKNPNRTFESELVNFLKTHERIVLKPIYLGSSVGLHIISDLESLEKVIYESTTFNDFEMMAEKFIPGREVTVGVIEDKNGIRALGPTEIILEQERMFDFNAKYSGLGVTKNYSPDLPNSIVKEIQDIAMESHKSLGCFGCSRTDLILSDDGIVLLETNAMPGLTPTSFIPIQLEVAGIELTEFIASQAKLAVARAHLDRFKLAGGGSRA